MSDIRDRQEIKNGTALATYLCPEGQYWFCGFNKVNTMAMWDGTSSYLTAYRSALYSRIDSNNTNYKMYNKIPSDSGLNAQRIMIAIVFKPLGL